MIFCLSYDLLFLFLVSNMFYLTRIDLLVDSYIKEIMISLYSTWWAKPEALEDLKPALAELAQNVEKHEPGTKMYLVHFPRYDFPPKEENRPKIISDPMIRPGTIIFVEKYESWDAFKAHLYGEYFTDFVACHKDKFVLDNKGGPFVQVVFMEEGMGFIRSGVGYERVEGK